MKNVPVYKEFLVQAFILFLMTCLILSGCRRPDNVEQFELLTDRNWQLNSIKKDGTEISESCDRDNQLTFETDKTLTYDRGSTICNDEQSTEIKGNRWKFEEDFNVIRMSFTISVNGVTALTNEYWKIMELSDSILILKDATAEDNNLQPEFRTYY